MKSKQSCARYIKLSENKFLIASLTRACKIQNDCISTRLPIKKDLLHLILKQIHQHFNQINQPYLATAYLVLFSTTYYGLFRIGEVTKGSHTIKAKDVHIAINKKKLLFLLWTSKTHNRSSKPQLIKISSCDMTNKAKSNHFCPFRLYKTT